jgi:hypothetical protein
MNARVWKRATILKTSEGATMGLTIFYRFSYTTSTVETAQETLLALQKKAQELDFIEIGELVVLQGKDCELDMNTFDDPHIELKIHAAKLLGIDAKGTFSYDYPICLLGFAALPGQGCAPTDFGLALYDKKWFWFSYCKTQYASNPEYGGLENFIACHLKMIHLLDAAKALGIQCQVEDNGQYWQTRDLEQLVENITEGNLLTAAVMGTLKDIASAQGAKLVAPITKYPNFEYLEGEGQ